MAKAYQAARLLAKAIQVRLQILLNKQYGLQDSELAKKALYEIGGNYQAIAVYDRAADFFERRLERPERVLRGEQRRTAAGPHSGSFAPAGVVVVLRRGDLVREVPVAGAGCDPSDGGDHGRTMRTWPPRGRSETRPTSARARSSSAR